MPKPTQEEVAELVGRLRADGPIAGAGALLDEAADALEALAGERAEVHIDYPILASTTQEAMGAAPPAKPAGELPVQIEQALEAALRWHQGDKYRFSNDEEKRTVWSDHQELLTDALRALRERA